MPRVKAALFAPFLMAAVDCERMPKEHVLGDYGSQPQTVVTALPDNQTPDVGPVVEKAKTAVAPLGDRIWPEPSRIIEHDAVWDVSFDFRKQRVESDGEQQVRAQMPESATVEVQKSDLSARLIAGR